MRPQVSLPDVVDHIVLLLRHHPALRGHLAETEGQRAVHAERVCAVLEDARGKAERGRQRPKPVPRPVAVDADTVIDRLASLEARVIEAGDEPGVIDVALGLRQSCSNRPVQRKLQGEEPTLPMMGSASSGEQIVSLQEIDCIANRYTMGSRRRHPWLRDARLIRRKSHHQRVL
jgi:hypothetical protein